MRMKENWPSGCISLDIKLFQVRQKKVPEMEIERKREFGHLIGAGIERG